MSVSIHTTIYETIDLPPDEVMALIGAGDVQGVVARQNQMKEFLDSSEWDLDKYKKYLQKDNKLPSKPRMVGNAIKAAAKIVKSAAAKVSDEVINERLNICVGCTDHYIPELERCSHPECGCFLRIKTAYKAMNCPIDKW